MNFSRTFYGRCCRASKPPPHPFYLSSEMEGVLTYNLHHLIKSISYTGGTSSQQFSNALSTIVRERHPGGLRSGKTIKSLREAKGGWRDLKIYTILEDIKYVGSFLKVSHYVVLQSSKLCLLPGQDGDGYPQRFGSRSATVTKPYFPPTQALETGLPASV